VRQIKIHDTHRTCGSLLAALEVHPRVAMAILRHSKIAMTMEIYTQVPDKGVAEAPKIKPAEDGGEEPPEQTR
jgi:integrase